MIKELIQKAESGESLWLPDLRQVFEQCTGASKAVVRLLENENTSREYTLFCPPIRDEEERAFLLRYAASNIYNILSTFSGSEVLFFCDNELQSALVGLPQLFEEPDSFGKVRNIARRIHGSFRIGFAPFSNYLPSPREERMKVANLTEKLRDLCKVSETKSCVGVDIGGSDIKLAASVKGKLIYTEEFDWNPASSPTAEGIVDPILSLIREAREKIDDAGGKLDAVGISFPDIVIRDQIVGGETPKTKAMRENTMLEYETEFSKLRDLKKQIIPLCSEGAEVHMTNDGNMAAFTAALELAAGGEIEIIRDGVIAHSLGTDLGTGWLQSDGTIPEFPLELYDLLLDLGDWPSASLPPEDLRSTRNENSGMNGARRYMGQAAAYRLAYKRDPNLIRDYVRQSDDVLYVPTAPVDLRKPCLEHLMKLASEGNPDAEDIFREIGSNLAVVTREMNWLFGSTPSTRILFGRFVKSSRCFELLCEGFDKARTGVRLLSADEDLANSSLMKQLAEMAGVTVAQFAQAIGSIYYAFCE